MFVGDSLSLNQWQSLVCLIIASVPNSKYSYSLTELLSSVTFEDYGITISLYHTLYLVDMVKEDVGVVLKLNSIQNGNAWLGMDMLIFDSWHWWTHTGQDQPWNYIQDGSSLIKDMDRLSAYDKALTTWGRWVDQNTDPSRTQVVFQGISPVHIPGADWTTGSGSCQGETKPVSGSNHPPGTLPEAIVVNKVLSGMKNHVYLLDITFLSELRKDAHPSAYSAKQSVVDCSHWCLPGLPDTWNQLLFLSTSTHTTSYSVQASKAIGMRFGLASHILSFFLTIIVVVLMNP